MMKNDDAAPTQRKVDQPMKPRHRLLPGAPTFQEYVDKIDAYAHKMKTPPLNINYLRDEYISTWGTN